ncbi:MAG: phosphate regulon transcriptional regulator PhoB [Methylococcaceae bacterium]|nr:phosphate regulon transcriptional regulator PhoB [Methylococcaceae bacterium]MCI0734528.1 phosphate regulon transcriptional regulator PhoB [Methylococcaceae bacterium]
MDIKILLVEDEPSIRDMLAMLLEQVGFIVQGVPDVQMAERCLKDNAPSIILLDWMLPGISGVEWCRRLKRDKSYSDIPVILVSARSEEEDKVRGLDVGADDYICKPFSPKELVARIRAVLRRSAAPENTERIEQKGIVLSLDEHRLKIDDTVVALSPTEYRLLEFFMTHPDKVYSRGQLLDHVWGRSTYIEERTVDVHIRRLRKILARFQREELVQTVRGFGYRFSLQGE